MSFKSPFQVTLSPEWVGPTYRVHLSYISNKAGKNPFTDFYKAFPLTPPGSWTFKECLRLFTFPLNFIFYCQKAFSLEAILSKNFN